MNYTTFVKDYVIIEDSNQPIFALRLYERGKTNR